MRTIETGHWSSVYRLLRALLMVVLCGFALLALAGISEQSAHPEKAYLVPSFDVEQQGASGTAPLRNGFYYPSTPKSHEKIFTANIADAVKDLEKPAILIAAVTRDAAASYCGRPLGSGEARASPSRFKGFDPIYLDLPKSDCSEGVLTVSVSAMPDSATLRRVYVGEAEELAGAYRWRRFWGVDVTIAATGVAALAALVALAALPLADRRMLYISFGAMMAFWAMRNLFYLGLLERLSDRATDLWFYGTTLGLMSTSVAFVNEWTTKSATIRRKLLPALGAAFLVTVIIIALGSDAAAGIAGRGSFILGLGCLTLIIIQLTIASQRENSPPYFETFLFLTGSFGGLLDLIGTIWLGFGPAIFGAAGQTMPHAPHMPILAACAMILVVARQNRDVRAQLATSNEQLAEKLDEREAEIRRVYQIRQEEERERTQFRERQRIMNDVHDGFGGRLLALLLRTENGELDQKGVTDGLRDSLQDLRLIVDSMDTADGDLELAFGALRGRVEPQLQAGGLDLDWQVELQEVEHHLGPTQILSIYRMIQEAATNSVRHAKASLVAIRVHWADDNCLHICIADDGQCDAPQYQAGRGLINIRNRAAELEGEASFRADESGFKVTITIPAKSSSK